MRPSAEGESRMIQSKLTYIQRAGLTVVFVALLWLAAGAGSAVAEPSAWWEITSSAWPASLPAGGEGTISVMADNVGDKVATGSPIALSDRLPAGLTVRGISFFTSRTGRSATDISRADCETTEQTVECHFAAEEHPIRPY